MITEIISFAHNYHAEQDNYHGDQDNYFSDQDN